MGIFSLITLRKIIFWTPILAGAQFVLKLELLHSIGGSIGGNAMEVVMNPMVPAVLPIILAATGAASETAAIMDFLPTIISSVLALMLGVFPSLFAVFRCSFLHFFFLSPAVVFFEYLLLTSRLLLFLLSNPQLSVTR